MGQPSAQEWAKSLGFGGISLIKPLGGFIERPDCIKYTFYPYVEGEVWGVQSEDEFHDAKKPVLGLTKILQEYGVDPIDLHQLQIMISDNRMYLIDLEYYHRVKGEPKW